MVMKKYEETPAISVEVLKNNGFLKKFIDTDQS